MTRTTIVALCQVLFFGRCPGKKIVKLSRWEDSRGSLYTIQIFVQIFSYFLLNLVGNWVDYDSSDTLGFQFFFNSIESSEASLWKLFCVFVRSTYSYKLLKISSWIFFFFAIVSIWDFLGHESNTSGEDGRRELEHVSKGFKSGFIFYPKEVIAINWDYNQI